MSLKEPIMIYIWIVNNAGDDSVYVYTARAMHMSTTKEEIAPSTYLSSVRLMESMCSIFI